MPLVRRDPRRLACGCRATIVEPGTSGARPSVTDLRRATASIDAAYRFPSAARSHGGPAGHRPTGSPCRSGDVHRPAPRSRARHRMPVRSAGRAATRRHAARVCVRQRRHPRRRHERRHEFTDAIGVADASVSHPRQLLIDRLHGIRRREVRSRPMPRAFPTNSPMCATSAIWCFSICLVPGGRTGSIRSVSSSMTGTIPRVAMGPARSESSRIRSF